MAHDERVQVTLNLVAHERLALLEDVHDRAHEPDELLRSHRLFHEVKGKIFVYRLYRRGHDRLVQEHRLERLRHVGRKLRGGHKPLLALRLDVHDVASRVLHEFEEHVLYRPVMREAIANVSIDNVVLSDTAPSISKLVNWFSGEESTALSFGKNVVLEGSG